MEQNKILINLTDKSSDKVVSEPVIENSQILSSPQRKKRINWKFRRISKELGNDTSRVNYQKNSIQYKLFLNNFQKNNINYLNLNILKVFLTIFGKIKARRKTRISLQLQKKLARSIKQARNKNILPTSIKITQNIIKRK